jgi:hypothetical protein
MISSTAVADLGVLGFVGVRNPARLDLFGEAKGEEQKEASSIVVYRYIV